MMAERGPSGWYYLLDVWFVQRKEGRKDGFMEGWKEITESIMMIMLR